MSLLQAVQYLRELTRLHVFFEEITFCPATTYSQINYFFTNRLPGERQLREQIPGERQLREQSTHYMSTEQETQRTFDNTGYTDLTDLVPMNNSDDEMKYVD